MNNNDTMEKAGVAALLATLFTISFQAMRITVTNSSRSLHKE